MFSHIPMSNAVAPVYKTWNIKDYHIPRCRFQDFKYIVYNIYFTIYLYNCKTRILWRLAMQDLYKLNKSKICILYVVSGTMHYLSDNLIKNFFLCKSKQSFNKRFWINMNIIQEKYCSLNSYVKIAFIDVVYIST